MQRLAVSAAVALSCLIVSAGAAVEEGLQPIERAEAVKIAKKLCEHSAKFEKTQVKIEPDTDKAVGLHAPGEAGLLVVPQKDLEEGEQLSAKFKNPTGAPLAKLFLFNILPVIDGKQIDASKLRSVKITDDNGKEYIIYTLLLSVRQLSEDDYRLYAYGYDEKPIIDTPFSEGAGPGIEPLAVEVKDIDKERHRGKIVITVFNKYQARFEAGPKTQ